MFTACSASTSPVSVVRDAMRIIVNKQLCSGHAQCNAVDEDLFPLDDLGYSEVTDGTVPAGLEKVAGRGASACPERAIRLDV